MRISVRKKAHIRLVTKAQVSREDVDCRFNYEPLLSAHPTLLDNSYFLGFKIGGPIFISSMTGGSSHSIKINRRIAKAAAKFNLPMGLGSIRPYIENPKDNSFNIREYTGADIPLFGNIGIAQLENLLEKRRTDLVLDAVNKLALNGLIIHINPLQEWVQPEGDRFKTAPLETLKEIIPHLDTKIIVKEVGCGFGEESLTALLNLPIDAIDLAGFGGTNFTKIEAFRRKKLERELLSPLIGIGHTPSQMIKTLNKNRDLIGPKEFIISGGIKDYLDGYYYKEKLEAKSIVGYAAKILKYAQQSEKKLFKSIEMELEGYNFAYNFLKIKD